MDPALRRTSTNLSSAMSDRSKSPISRTATPGLSNPNIAPQHLFDSVAMDGQSQFQSPSIPYSQFRVPSPAPSINGSHLEPPPSYESHKALQTRVSELEVINELFRGRVEELELLARETEAKARNDVEEAKRKIEELESELAEYRELGHKHKKVHLSDLVDESQASTPISEQTPSG